MKFTKLLAGVISATIICGSISFTSNNPLKPMTSIAAEEYEKVTVGDFTFNVYSDHADLAAIKAGVDGDIIIPSIINEVPVTGIDKLVFNAKQEFSSITLPDKLTVMNSQFNYNTSLMDILISSENENFTSSDGVLFNKDKTELVAYPLGKKVEEYIIPDGVKSIHDYAFSNNITIKKVHFPDSIEEIHYSAFSGCTNLEAIDLPMSLVKIYQGAFSICRNLKSVTVPKSVTSIGNNAFALCSNLQEIYILNPECIINGRGNTIANNSIDNPDGSTSIIYVFEGTIYGYEGTATQEYAEKYGYKFEPLGKYNSTITSTSTTTTSTTTTTSPTTSPIQSQQKYPLGDVNNDGQINAVDASSVLSYYAMVSTNKDGEFDDNQMAASDVNNDGLINAVDASCILSYYAYVSTTKDEILPLEAFLKKK